MQMRLLEIVLTTPVAINSFVSIETLSFTPGNIDVDIDFETLSGKTEERVYLAEEGGRKVGQLDWKFNNAATIKGAINWDLMSQISTGAASWTTLDSRGGNMVDWNWMNSNNLGTWTDESRHPDTQLDYANELDLNIKGWLFNGPNYRLGLMAGYQESRYNFTARGGSYICGSEGGFRDDIGSSPSGEGIVGYKQRFKMPYTGLTGGYRYEDFELGGTFEYSGWVEAFDNDEHCNPGKGVTYHSKVKD